MLIPKKIKKSSPKMGGGGGSEIAEGTGSNSRRVPGKLQRSGGGVGWGGSGRRERTGFLATRVFLLTPPGKLQPGGERGGDPRLSPAIGQRQPHKLPKFPNQNGGGVGVALRSPETQQVLPTSRTPSLANTEALRKTAASQSVTRRINPTLFKKTKYSLGNLLCI